MRINKILYLLFPAIGGILSGCQSDEIYNEGLSKAISLKIVAPSLTSTIAESSELPQSVTLYIFSDEKFRTSQTLKLSDNTEIEVRSDEKVYCVAGAEIGNLSASTTLADFTSRTVTSAKGAASAPMFYAGAGRLNDKEDAMEIELCRGVARVDLACADPKMKLREVIVENAPASSLIIPGDTPLVNEATVAYTRTIPSDFDGVLEEAFIVFESAGQVTVRLKGTYDGDPMNMVTQIPVIERNKKYTLTVSGGSELESMISISDWKDGDQALGVIDPGQSGIDMKTSVIPEGVEIDKSTSTIRIPYTGVKDMKISFRMSKPVTLTRMLGEMEKFSIQTVDPVKEGDSYISSFLINADPQPKAAQGYESTIILGGENMFYYNLEMAPSPYQVPTVFIGGHEWMCFNAVSNNIDDQLFLSGDMTVEKMYNEHFIETVGKYFQYGKENPFDIFESNDPNLFASQTRDIPWATPERMPVPKGFHVASFAEWKDLVPNKFTIPARYKCAAGDSIQATVVTLPGTLESKSAATNAQGFKMRYVLFESLTTGAKLYVPFIGIKANNKDEVPTQKGYKFETRSGYWMKDNRAFMLFDFVNSADGSGGVLIQQSNWNYDGFIGVRGIKD